MEWMVVFSITYYSLTDMGMGWNVHARCLTIKITLFLCFFSFSFPWFFGAIMPYHRFNLTTVPGCEREGGERIMSQHHHQFMFVSEQVNSSIINTDSEVRKLENRVRFDPALRKALRV